MKMPQIKIEQRTGKIGLQIKKPQQSLRQEKSTLEIHQDVGKLKIKKDVVEVNVDNYPARYDLGYKNSSDMVKQSARQGKEAVIKAIGQYSQQGDQLMRIENKGKPLVQQAKQATQAGKKEIGLRWKRGPKINVKPHKLELDYKPNYPSIKSSMGSVATDLERGTVKVSLDQYNKLKISLTGNRLNRLI
jgi:hypothetical protein